MNGTTNTEQLYIYSTLPFSKANSTKLSGQISRWLIYGQLFTRYLYKCHKGLHFTLCLDFPFVRLFGVRNFVITFIVCLMVFNATFNNTSVLSWW